MQRVASGLASSRASPMSPPQLSHVPYRPSASACSARPTWSSTPCRPSAAATSEIRSTAIEVLSPTRLPNPSPAADAVEASEPARTCRSCSTRSARRAASRAAAVGVVVIRGSFPRWTTANAPGRCGASTGLSPTRRREWRGGRRRALRRRCHPLRAGSSPSFPWPDPRRRHRRRACRRASPG